MKRNIKTKGITEPGYNRTRTRTRILAVQGSCSSCWIHTHSCSASISRSSCIKSAELPRLSGGVNFAWSEVKISSAFSSNQLKSRLGPSNPFDIDWSKIMNLLLASRLLKQTFVLHGVSFFFRLFRVFRLRASEATT